MRIPFVRRRATTTPPIPPRRTTTFPASTTTPGLAAGTTRRQVPGPEVMAGMEYLDTPSREAVRAPAPDVAVCGIDPQVPGSPAVPRLHLVVPDEGPEGTRPDSVEQLLTRDGAVRVRRLTVDVRGLRDVLESRGGWNLLAALVRDPSDSVTNAVFRAAMSAPDSAGSAGAVLEPGDVDVEVCVVGEGDTVAGRCRRELGRGRLSLTGFLADSERLTRRLAEALARPRDRATRRCFEHALADVLADAPLSALLGRHGAAPYCTVPGTWATPPTAATPVPRRAAPSEQAPSAPVLEEAAPAR
ncbi:hypothetical protein [Actinomycetospora chibensis]|uniref:Uncharacterized protein n=1 Tax=Actinomycetospora chibensis TaxID=663606 RepID=A0ABV9RID0_9PSEU|nr:hypothetical protein [Actinomycetospora chibensis]MDD7923350.1 hypothetical protein [Actinomycetospora chibensis]